VTSATDTQYALDPTLKAVLEMGKDLPPIEGMSPAEARAFYAESCAATGGEPREMAKTEDRRIPGPNGEIPIRIYWPKGLDAKAPVLAYFHGGGWVIGDLDTHDRPCRVLADEARCIVVATDYRMAPEHVFPAAAEDCVAAYAWIAANAASLGGDPSRIAVGGDSAGGNLAAVVAQQARKRGLTAPVFQLLIYPVTDMAANTSSYRTYGEGLPLSSAVMHWFIDHYLGKGRAGAADERAAPLVAKDLAGLPPAAVLLARFDVLLDEGVAYAEKLKAAGVPVTFRVYDTLTHGFVSLGGVVDAARTALIEIAADLKRGFAGV
jgi:acetyl esterase